MNALLKRDVLGRFIFYHSSLLLWMGCGDRCRNKVPTGSFKVFGSCQGEYLLTRKKKQKVRGKEWSQEGLWAQGLEEQVQAAPEQMGARSSERKWLSGWVVVSGRRNADGRQC